MDTNPFSYLMDENPIFPSEISLIPLDRYNWEECLDITLTPEQSAFIPPVLYSLAQAKFEALTPYGIRTSERMVGLLMYGEFTGLCWINRIMVDVAYQQKGIGSVALKTITAQLKRNVRCKEIRASYAPDNYAAAALFASAGFHPLAASLENEVVVQYRG